MRIEDIEVMNLYFEYPASAGFLYAGGQVTGRVTSIFRVLADNGLVGLGASYSYPDIVRIIIEHHLKPLLIGDDPTRVEELWDKMYALTRWYGRKGAAMSAIGGLDIAFWDLRGKALGKPVYELLGGASNVVPAYASGLFWQDDVRALEKEAASYREHDFHRVKMRLGRSQEYDVSALDAVQRGIASDGDVIVDGSHRYSRETAEWLGEILGDRKVFWFEEPFPPEEIDSYVALRPKLPVPLAAGENDFGAQGFRELLRAGALDIVQPDACRAGGITECFRVGQAAAARGVRIATHTWSDAVALVANAHVVAALPNGITIEVDQTGNPFIEDLLSRQLRIKDGMLVLSSEPGLGIDLDEATVDRLALHHDQLMPDGNYSDLIFGAQFLNSTPPYLATPV